MVAIVRTHTYFMTYKEYKKKYLNLNQPNMNVSIQNNILTRTHIIFV